MKFGTIVITRPEPQGKVLCDEIKQLGYNALLHPFLSIEGVTPSAYDLAKIQKLDTYDGVIVTSQHAVSHSINLLKKYFPKAPTLDWFAIGDATKKELMRYAPSVIVPAGKEQTSEGLLALPLLQNISQKKFLIIKGREGRTLLQETLIARGANLDSLDCYQRKKTMLPLNKLKALWQESALPLIVITSNSTLDYFYSETKAITEKLKITPLIVVSPRAKAHAKTLGFQHVFTANAANNQAIINVIQTISDD